MTAKQLSVAELDFDKIKLNLKEFLSSQSEFTDYNFEGSALSTILDILAYNTHYNSLYHNMTFNESFLDSAVKRSSVVSRARDLGYTPRSSTAPKAIVNLTISNASSGAPNILALPRGSTFQTSIDGTNYVFTTLEHYTAQKVGTTYTFSNVSIYQGTLLSNRYLVQNNTKFIIPNEGCDTSTLSVYVQESAVSSSLETFKLSTSIIDPKVFVNSKIYYLKEIDNGLYEVYFGRDVVGKQPVNGNIVILSYLVTSNVVTNGASVFTYTGQSLAGGTASVSVIEVSRGGQEQESIESIVVNASNSFTSQNRAVNASDYRTIILNSIPGISSVSVWGGEDNIPKIYGKVFLSIKPTGRNNLTEVEKTSVENLLRGKMVGSITVGFVDPESIRISLNSNIYYNPALTNLTIDSLQLKVIQSVDTYNVDFLNKFETIFRHSVLVASIDNSDDSINSNITSITLYKDYTPPVGSTVKETVRIHNPISTISSNTFYVTGYSDLVYLKSDINNKIHIYDFTTNTIVRNSVGDLNYDYFTLNNFVISSLSSQYLTFEIKPTSNDVVAKLQQFVYIDLAKSTFNLIPENGGFVFTTV